MPTLFRTLCKAMSPRQTAAQLVVLLNCQRLRRNQGSSRVAQVGLTLPEGQLVDGIDDEHRVPIETLQVPTKFYDRWVVVIVVVLAWHMCSEK